MCKVMGAWVPGHVQAGVGLMSVDVETAVGHFVGGARGTLPSFGST